MLKKLEENECGSKSLRIGGGTEQALLLESLGVGRRSQAARGTGTPQQSEEV